MTKLISLLLSAIFSLTCFSQNTGIGIGTTNPHPSAELEINSTNKGFLPPRMTFAERNAINNPAQGLIIYCIDCGNNGGEPQYFNGSNWFNLIGEIAKVGPANLSRVSIGTQIWQSKNLDVASYRNGDPIPHVTDPTQWSNLTTGAWSWYNNDSATYAAAFGRLYNWYAVADPRGLCPTGWHVPSDAEWNKLVKFIDTSADTLCLPCVQSFSAGGSMKDSLSWNSPNFGATNTSGFSALAAGLRQVNGTFGGSFGNTRERGYWWSSTEYATNSSFYRTLYFDNASIYRGYPHKLYGMSVRCIRD